jgi:hypothetical protein
MSIGFMKNPLVIMSTNLKLLRLFKKDSSNIVKNYLFFSILMEFLGIIMQRRGQFDIWQFKEKFQDHLDRSQPLIT